MVKSFEGKLKSNPSTRQVLQTSCPIATSQMLVEMMILEVCGGPFLITILDVPLRTLLWKGLSCGHTLTIFHLQSG